MGNRRLRLLLLYSFLGYCIGSIPFSQLIAQWRAGVDLRTSGYRNVGAYNVIHTIGFAWGLLAGILDTSKVLITMVFMHTLGVTFQTSLWVGLCVMAGHNFPVWLGFQGGKGVSVLIGLMFWVVPLETLIALGIAVLVFAFVGRVNISVALAYIGLMLFAVAWHHYNKIQVLLYGSIPLIGLAYLPRFIRWLGMKRIGTLPNS